MIKNISGGGKYITVTGSPGSTYVNNYSGAQGVGNMRFNTTTQNIEVFDGSNWIQMQSGYTTISMTPEAESLLEWAKAKRDEEEYLKKQAETSPAIKDLITQRNEIDHKITMVKTLLQSECKVCQV